MAVYYNEIDPFAVSLLGELMKAGIIADGDVDTRSIEDVLPGDLVGYSQHHFFAVAGCWSIALRLCGWPDDRPVWTGSCPCQPFSKAGKGQGFADERHLWPAFHWLISQYRPSIVFGEQVGGQNILSWFDLVSDDLEALGYAVRACDFPAAGVGAPHIRQRLYWCGLGACGLGNAFFQGLEGYAGDVVRAPGRADQVGPIAETGASCRVAYANGLQWQWGKAQSDDSGLSELADDSAAGRMGDAFGDGRDTGQGDDSPLGFGSVSSATGGLGRPCSFDGFWRDADWLFCRDGKWRPAKPGLVPLVDGFAGRHALLRAIGNAIVPQQAAAFIEAVTGS